jgi:predicted transcriptional regulator
MVVQLGPLEMQVLGLLHGEEPSSVSQVRARLASRGQELAYTTVMTVLARLHDKGLVAREREGKRLQYRLDADASRVKDSILARIRRSLFDHDKLRPVVALLEDERLSDEDLRALRALIDERLADKGTR